MMRSKALALTASAVLFVAGLSLPRIFAQDPPAIPPPERPPVTLELTAQRPHKLACRLSGTHTLSARPPRAREMEQPART